MLLHFLLLYAHANGGGVTKTNDAVCRDIFFVVMSIRSMKLCVKLYRNSKFVAKYGQSTCTHDSFRRNNNVIAKITIFMLGIWLYINICMGNTNNCFVFFDMLKVILHKHNYLYC